jgi:hypothetical protein
MELKLNPLATGSERTTYENHCDNITAILASTFFVWRAKRKIRAYLKLTGAAVE